MKVLLVSPKDPDQPGDLKFLLGGENTFTRSLLANPPVGVEYVHHAQALVEGCIGYSLWQKTLSSLMTAKLWPPDAGFQCFQFKDRFDLVHCHAYTGKFEGFGGPVVLSDSSSNYCFLKDYLGWSQARIALGYQFRKFVSRKFGLNDPNFNLTGVKKLIVWSEFARKTHQKLGADPGKIAIIPPGIEALPVKKKKHQGFNILFIGIWFERKGGLLLCQAYDVLKRKYPQIRLFLVGQMPSGFKLPKDTWQQDFLTRERLIKEIFPLADVLVLVPPVVEGYGLVVLEAASLGIPSIVSSVYALSEIVEDKKTGLVIAPGDWEVLRESLDILITDRPLLEKMGQSAKEKFEKEFAIGETNKKLLKIYQAALER